MGAIVTVPAINRMVIRGLNIILLMSTGVIAAEVCIFAPIYVYIQFKAIHIIKARYNKW